jgi:hypothetical protein
LIVVGPGSLKKGALGALFYVARAIGLSESQDFLRFGIFVATLLFTPR